MNPLLINLILSGAQVCMESKPNMPVKVIKHTNYFAEVAMWDHEQKIWVVDNMIHPMALYTESWRQVRCPEEK